MADAAERRSRASRPRTRAPARQDRSQMTVDYEAKNPPAVAKVFNDPTPT